MDTKVPLKCNRSIVLIFCVFLGQMRKYNEHQKGNLNCTWVIPQTWKSKWNYILKKSNLKPRFLFFACFISDNINFLFVLFLQTSIFLYTHCQLSLVRVVERRIANKLVANLWDYYYLLLVIPTNVMGSCIHILGIANWKWLNTLKTFRCLSCFSWMNN